MSEVFVSYSHRDHKPVSHIADVLGKRGHEIWWDHRLRAHQDFGLEIEAALYRANCTIVAWSSSARDSLWVRAEATEAWETRKLVQITLDGVKPPLPFTMVHLLNLSDWSGDPADPVWGDLEEAVEAITVGRGSTLETTSAPPLHFAGLGRSVAIGATSLGLVVVASGIVAIGVSGGFSTNLFGVLSTAMFLGSLLTFAHMLTRVIKVALASR